MNLPLVCWRQIKKYDTFVWHFFLKVLKTAQMVILNYFYMSQSKMEIKTFMDLKKFKVMVFEWSKN